MHFSIYPFAFVSKMRVTDAGKDHHCFYKSSFIRMAFSKRDECSGGSGRIGSSG